MTVLASALQPGGLIAPGLEAVDHLGGGVDHEVWLAFDVRRHCAVVAKVVRPERDTAEVREALAREAALLDRLRHPGLVRVLEAQLDGDHPHLRLQHVDGPTLSSLISREGALPLHQLMAVGLELASAVTYLHAEGVVHLDLKPSNVVAGSPAHLLDVGIARSVDEAADLRVPVGSDQYMAPEQCEPGVRGVIGPDSDVFGLGATLFRAAAGRRAWPSSPQHAQLVLPPLALPSHLPRPVAEVLQACLAPLGDDRPAAVEVAQVFEQALYELPAARLAGFSLR